MSGDSQKVTVSF